MANPCTEITSCCDLDAHYTHELFEAMFGDIPEYQHRYSTESPKPEQAICIGGPMHEHTIQLPPAGRSINFPVESREPRIGYAVAVYDVTSRFTEGMRILAFRYET